MDQAPNLPGAGQTQNKHGHRWLVPQTAYNPSRRQEMDTDTQAMLTWLSGLARGFARSCPSAKACNKAKRSRFRMASQSRCGSSLPVFWTYLRSMYLAMIYSFLALLRAGGRELGQRGHTNPALLQLPELRLTQARRTKQPSLPRPERKGVAGPAARERETLTSRLTPRAGGFWTRGLMSFGFKPGQGQSKSRKYTSRQG